MVACWSVFIPFYGLTIFHYMYILHFDYPFICWWAFGLCLPFDYYCYKHSYTNVWVGICVHFFRYISKSRTSGSHVILLFNFFEKPPYCFSHQLNRFAFVSTMYKCFYFSTSSPILLFSIIRAILGWLPGDSDGKESAYNVGDPGSVPGSGRFPWRRKWLLTPEFMTGEFHGQRSLVGYSPWGHSRTWLSDHH